MIHLITLTIALLGALLLTGLYLKVRAFDRESRLRRHRATKAGLADLLNYAAVVDNGIIVGKNGSLMAGWLYKGADAAASTEQERELVSARLNQALSRLGNGWMIHIDAARRPAPEYPDASRSAFPDRVSEAIDDERRTLFEGLGTMYEGYFVLVLTWYPPLLAERRFVEMMFDDDRAKPNQTERTEELVRSFNRDVEDIQERLSICLSDLTRLQGHRVLHEDGSTVIQDDFLSWLQFSVTGVSHPVILPRNPMYIDSLIGGQELFGGVVPKIGRKFISVVAIEGFPLESTPGILNSLAELPCEYRWSSRFIFMDEHEAIRHLEKFQKKWKQKVRGFFDQLFNQASMKVDEDAMDMVADAGAALAEINSQHVALCYYTSSIVLLHESRETLEALSRSVETAINSLGFAARVETINTLDAFVGTLPGHGVQNVRRPLINTLNLADMIPISTVWTGEEMAPCPWYPARAPALMQCVTTGRTPFRLNFHVGQLGHGIILGPTRAGKSTLMAMIAAQFRRYAGMQIFVFDFGMAMYPITKAVGGEHFMLSADSGRLECCPLQYLETPSDREWAIQWICDILILNDIPGGLTPAIRNEVAKTIRNMHESGPEARSLSDFAFALQSQNARETLQPYLAEGTVDPSKGGGGVGFLLDAKADNLSLADFSTFELTELMDLPDRYALPVLMYLFRRIDKVQQGSNPKAILLDEAWLMLDHPLFKERLRQWLKSKAKANCSVIMATQNLSDAARSDILDVILESTATKIFLPNHHAREDEAATLYRRMGLNARQIEVVSTAVPQRDYYYVSGDHHRLFQLALGPFAKSFVGATDNESLARIDELVRQYGDDWVEQWLDIRSVGDALPRRVAA